MKFFKKIGIIFINTITYIQIFFYKVYANIRIEVGPVYGVEEPPKSKDIIMESISILKMLIVPVILLMGFIVYNKKSKNNKYKDIVKIAIFIMSVVIFILLVLMLASIIKKYF